MRETLFTQGPGRPLGTRGRGPRSVGRGAGLKWCKARTQMTKNQDVEGAERAPVTHVGSPRAPVTHVGYLRTPVTHMGRPSLTWGPRARPSLTWGTRARPGRKGSS